MSYSYDFEAFEALGAGMGIFYTVYMILCYGIAIATYVLRSAGFYTIAKRRGINHAWMSWVPVLNLWVLGCISDQYQYVVKGKNKNKRKWLIGLSIALAVLYIVFFVVLIVTVFGMVGTVAGGATEDQIVEAVMGPVLGMMAGMLPLMCVALAMTVVRYFAMYDLYTSCSPQNNVLFLVLSIFFNVTEPFFVFFNRKNDGGMPPRREEVQPQAYIPPQYETPQYEPSRYEQTEDALYEQPSENE